MSAVSGRPPKGRLRELIADPRNSISVENVAAIDPELYERSVEHLSRYVFWHGKSRRVHSLWPHQSAAISLGAAYLSADRRIAAEGGVPEAALIKMPTGTGKSGVIAVLSRCLPDVRRVLILTPRTALADQLREDIRWRFWSHLRLEADETATFVSDTSSSGAEISGADIVEFLPSKAEQFLHHVQSAQRLIAVGTFQALEQIRRSVSDEVDHSEGASSAERRALEAIRSFDVVIVDEGHYEPAPAWSRAVRDFALPTILLSATPYRNDYKSFRVRGRFVFNYPFDKAIDEKTIRDVRYTSAPARKRVGNDVARFVTVLSAALPRIFAQARSYTDQPKVIVRADSFKKLVQLQGAIEKAFDEKPIVIHDQIRGSEPDKRRFHSVARARKSADWKHARFWLHESKLLEGIDDPSFVAVALYDGFSNARQLVQQIGRALRTTDKRRRSLQLAWVISAQELGAIVESSWSRYLAFERYAAKDPQNLVQAEGALPDKLLAMMPDVQYLNGEFRPRFSSDQVQRATEFRLPASASVFEVGESFDIEVAAKEVEERLLAEDRFRPQRIEGMPVGTLAFAYYGWRSSPYLELQFFPEWTLGVCALVRSGDLLLISDTGGIVLDPVDLGVRRVDRVSIAKLMPKTTATQPVRVSRMAMFSLDLSDRAIRSMALRTHSFADTFGDLLEPVLVPTTTFGFVGGRGRYLGLTRGRVSDSYAEPLPLLEFCAWAQTRAAEIQTRGRAHNAVFDRYARIRGRLNAEQAAPLNILLDFDETLADYAIKTDADTPPAQPEDVQYDDLCADIGADGRFQISLAAKRYVCTVGFNETTQRYSIESEDLDKVLYKGLADAGVTQLPVTEYLNREQSFRIIPREPGVIYAHRKFFEPNTSYLRPDGSIPLLDRVYRVPALDATSSEKGEALYRRRRAAWRKESVFGVVKAICESGTPAREWAPLFRDLRSFDTIVCDDDGEEIGDFLAIDESGKRVALIHAKVGRAKSGMSVRALQEVGRQVLASLAFCSAVAREAKIKSGRWGTRVNANGVVLNLSRIFRNENGASVASIERLAASALANRSWSREIWIVGGSLMSREVVENAIRNANSNRAQQFLMYLDALITGCARGHSTLRIYCN